MHQVSKRWRLATPISPQADQELRAYHPILRQILYSRGLSTREAAQPYLEAAPPPGTTPFALADMGAAVERIRWAISKKEPIAVYGDYDADGVTATALMVQALSSLGADVEEYIPNRFEEGYGLNIVALDKLKEKGIHLVITVDCGIRSLKECEHTRGLGLDLVIVDHHQPGNELPRVSAVINPKQPGDTYPEKDLAGVGLAYKLASALLTPDGDAADRPEDYLDLVALGTVADLVSLVGENRTLVRQGLRYIREPRRQGLQALIGVSGLKHHRIRAADIGFVLGPRLNAAGRLDSALAAFRLLTSSDIQEVGKLAWQLDNQNRKRQKITRDIQRQAEEIALAEDPEGLMLFAAHPQFNPGVVGLAASRLSDQYYRPAIVVNKGDELSRGSCRSIPEFHITDALDECADLLVRYGGHAAAAGFTVRSESLPALEARLREITHQRLGDLDLAPTITADVELPLSDLHPEVLDELEALEPTGQGNPVPYFITRSLRVAHSRVVGRDGTHLKLAVTDGRITYDAIAFRQGFWYQDMPSQVDLLYVFETNEFNSRTTLQLNVKDLKPAGAS